MNSKEIVKDLLAAWEAHDLTQTADLLADNFTLTGAAPQLLNKETFLIFQRVHNEAFPDWKFNVIEFETRGNEVEVACRISATHTGIYDLSKLGMAIKPILPRGQSLRWPLDYMACIVKNGRVSQIKVDTAPGDWITGIIESLATKPSVRVM
jgi:hypothetical protein